MHWSTPYGAVGSVLLAAGLLGPAAPAQAATGSTIVADQQFYTVVYRAGAGQENDPTTTATWRDTDPESIAYTVHDVAPITPGAGCSWPDPADETTVECVLGGGRDFTPSLTLHLGDRADHYDEPGSGTTVYGGAGADLLVTGNRGTLYGEAGDDVLAGRIAYGGGGDDRITGALIGKGGDGADHVTGTDRGDLLEGGRGDDTVGGLGGRDLVHGNSGNDLLTGGTGNDDLSGGPGHDRLHGNSGNDLLIGGPGRDVVSGGPGKDVTR